MDVILVGPMDVGVGDDAVLEGSYTSGDGASESPSLLVSWGDGSTDTYGVSQCASACCMFSYSHAYNDAGSFDIDVEVTDDTGSDAESTSIVVTADESPWLSPTLSTTTVDEGETLSMTGSFGHPDTSETVTLQIDWGDGTTDTATGTPDGSIMFDHAYSTEGSYDVRATATDDDYDVASFGPETVIVNGVVDEYPWLSPTLSATTVDEGETLAMTGSFGHAETSETVTLQIDWGDGLTDTATGTPDGSIEFDHAYSTEGSYDVRVTATDGDYDVASFGPETVIVNGVADESPSLAPTLSATTVDEGETLTMTGSFGHPETSETVTLQIDWGDNTSETATGFPDGSLDFYHAYS